MCRLTDMKKIFIIWLAFFGLTLSSTAYAAQDVRLLIDLSGSMNQNDPRSLRSESLRLFIDQLQEGDKAGVWTFANQVNMLVPYGSVNNDWKSLARQRISDVNSLGQWTNIGKALETAATSMPDPKQGTSFILITDGKVDIAKDDRVNQAERQRILNEIIPDIRKRGGSVHSIALTDSVDVGVLARLAKETQGSFYQAKDLNGLEAHLLNVIGDIKDDGEVPIIDNKFFVDKTTRSFKATLFKGSPSTAIVLKAPDGQVYQTDGDYAWVDWMSAGNYDEIVVTLPRGGIWEIVGSITSESQVTLDSDLGIHSSMSEQIVFPGESVAMDMTVMSYGRPVLEPAYLNLLEVSSQVFDDNKKPKTVKTRRIDGRYQIEMDPFIVEPGSYQVETIFSGPDFIRQVTGTIQVLNHLSLDVVKQDASYIVKVSPVNPEVSQNNTRLQAVLHYPDSQTKVIDLIWQKGGYWQASITSDEKGTHQLKTSARIQLPGKQVPITFETQMLTYPLPAQIKKAMEQEALLAKQNMELEAQKAGDMLDMVAADNQPDTEVSEELNEESIALLDVSEADEDTIKDSEGMEQDTVASDSLTDADAVDEDMGEDMVEEARPFIKYPIEVVEVLDPELIVVVPVSDEQLVAEDPWIEKIPEEIAVESGPSFFELFLWSLPALAIIGGFYLFFFKFMKHRRDLTNERSELEDMIRMEEEKAEQAANFEEENEDPTENFVPYDEEAIENANNIDVDDLGKDTEHLFDEDIVSMPDMTSESDTLSPPELTETFSEEGDEDDDVFDLGDLSDLSDEVEESIEDEDEYENKDELK